MCVSFTKTPKHQHTYILIHNLCILPRRHMNYPIMSSIQHHNFIDQDNFLADCLLDNFLADCLLEFDFSREFGFGSAFSSIFGNGWDDTLSYDNDDVSCEVSIEGFVKLKRKRKRKKRRKNRSYRLDSVKNSCWFTNFLQPGKVRSLIYDLSSSDRFAFKANLL